MIDMEKANYSIVLMCRVLEVSRSGYYSWSNREEVTPAAAARAEQLDRIETIHEVSRETYGSPRVHAQLVRDGFDISVNTVARRMRDAGIAGRVRRRHRATTDSKHGNAISSNVLNREFDRETPDSAWCADIKAVPTASGWVYLAAIIDVATRMIVGWAMERHMRASLIVAAFEDAMNKRKPAETLIHHSDRRVQYTSQEYRDALDQHDVTTSMSRKGNCWDNALIESFFGTYAQELVLHEWFRGLEDARQATFEYIDLFYNSRRLHSALGYKSPAEVDAERAKVVA